MSPRTAFIAMFLMGVLYTGWALLVPPGWTDFGIGVTVAMIGLIGADITDRINR